MGQFIHPNQFPSVQTTLESENDDPVGGMGAALKFLEGIDYDDDSLRQRRRRRAERAATTHVGRMGAHAVIYR